MTGALIKSDKASNQLSIKKRPEALCIRGLGYCHVTASKETYIDARMLPFIMLRAT